MDGMHLFNIHNTYNIGFLAVVKNTMVIDTQYLLTNKKRSYTRATEYMSYYFGTSINGLGST